MKQRKGILFLLSVLALSFFLLFPEVFAKEGCAVCKEYRDLGFPNSFAERLCALSAEHPEWEFEPLFITEISRTIGEEYDFETVVARETEVKERNLVFAKADYSDYWASEKKSYDSGFYAASEEAVAYFLDPRNFLTEEGVFQFLPLSSTRECSMAGVERALSGSAPEKAPLAGGKGMAEVLSELGEKWKIHPLHLAVRLRQEQGEAGNALLWGTAGDYLEEIGAKGGEELNGYYNPFNISASGNSEAEIYRSGALFAKKMGWTSLDAALAGGVEYLAKKYVLCYQNTLYLQKWNVDARSAENGKSRNFWGQYMQNIGGAKLEAQAVFSAFEKASLLEEKLSFLIPVYEKMPEKPAPDPAGGSCPAFSASPPPAPCHAIPAGLLSFSKEPEKTRDRVSGEENKAEWSFLWWIPILILFFFHTQYTSFLFFGKKRRLFW